MVGQPPTSKVIQEFHFPGGLEYLPMAVRAHTREEAEAQWIKTRIPAKQKVELETNNN